MAIILSDMEMPECCDECPMYYDGYDYPTCYLTTSRTGYNFDIRDKRMKDCPLQEAYVVNKREGLYRVAIRSVPVVLEIDPFTGGVISIKELEE